MFPSLGIQVLQHPTSDLKMVLELSMLRTEENGRK
jgi:hypothetical protein